MVRCPAILGAAPGRAGRSRSGEGRRGRV